MELHRDCMRRLEKKDISLAAIRLLFRRALYIPSPRRGNPTIKDARITYTKGILRKSKLPRSAERGLAEEELVLAFAVLA